MLDQLFSSPRAVHLGQIEAVADRWVSHTPAHHAQRTGHASKVVFVSVATGWLGFGGARRTA
jgi:hypothetical protein